MESRVGVIIDHDVIVIMLLGRFYQRPVFLSPLFHKLNNGHPLITTFDPDFQIPSFLNPYFQLFLRFYSFGRHNNKVPTFKITAIVRWKPNNDHL